MKHIKLSFCFVSFIFSINIFAIPSQNVIQLINKQIPKILASNKTTGAAVALVNNQGIIWARGFGYLSKAKKYKVNTKTLFSMESDSKQFTALGVLAAVHRGKLNLNRPISTYLAGFKVNSRFSNKNPIRQMTLKNLLSHTAGLPHEAPVGNNTLIYSPSFEAYVKSIQNVWLSYPVGQRFAYSNLGIDLAGYILQKQFKLSFAVYMQKYVLDPLGMKESTFDMNQIKKVKNRAIGNLPDFKKVPLVMPFIPAGGLYSNVLDMGKYIQFQLNNGQVGNKQIFPKKQMQIMRTIPYPKPGQQYGYALGIVKVKLGKTIFYNHNGEGFGFISTINWIPKYHVGFVMLFNGRVDAQMIPLLKKVINKISHQHSSLLNTISIKSVKPKLIFRELLNTWCGHYIGRSNTMTVAFKDKKFGFIQNKKFSPFIYLGDNRFYTPALKQIYRFVPATSKQVKYIEQISNGHTWDYNDSLNDPKGPNKKVWQRYVGNYRMLNTAHVKIILRVHIKNGYLYLNDFRLKEFQPKLFTDCRGHVLDLRPEHLSWNNIKIGSI